MQFVRQTRYHKIIKMLGVLDIHIVGHAGGDAGRARRRTSKTQKKASSHSISYRNPSLIVVRVVIMLALPPTLNDALNLSNKSGPVSALHVFDFDGTLVRTPGPDIGKAVYLRETGRTWKGGWWGRLESLSPPIVPSPVPVEMVVQSVMSELEEVVTRSQTAVGLVVTGRIRTMRPAVLRVLDEVCAARENESVNKGESFLKHEAIFTHPGGGMKTLDFKRELFRQLLTSPPLVDCGIKELHIWEDRQEHAEVFATSFKDEVQAQVNVETIVHYVPAELP